MDSKLGMHTRICGPFPVMIHIVMNQIRFDSIAFAIQFLMTTDTNSKLHE